MWWVAPLAGWLLHENFSYLLPRLPCWLRCPCIAPSSTPDAPLTCDVHLAPCHAAGRRAQLFGPQGTAVIRFIDRCPECSFADVDTTQSVFQAIVGPLSIGRTKITWNFVDGPLRVLLPAGGAGLLRAPGGPGVNVTLDAAAALKEAATAAAAAAAAATTAAQAATAAAAVATQAAAAAAAAAAQM